MRTALSISCFLLGLQILPSCISALFTGKDKKSEEFQFPSPGADWEVMDPGEANIAYRHKVDQAVLNVSSSCGEGRFQTLESLAADILRQLPESQYVEAPRTQTIGNFPGLVVEARGLVDTKILRVRLAVIRTQTCLFDIILAGNELAPSSRLAFDWALRTFSERPLP